MKAKLGIAFLSLFLTLTVITSHASILDPIFKGKAKTTNTLTDEQKTARLEEIKTRVEVIKATDKSTLSRSERKSMKKELREMNREAKAMKGGVYLSVGAIIIIILLLILIL
ncbi:MAG: hypothetical protein ABWZ25_06095 [Chitinophagaceae bacterium]